MFKTLEYSDFPRWHFWVACLVGKKVGSKREGMVMYLWRGNWYVTYWDGEK